MKSEFLTPKQRVRLGLELESNKVVNEIAFQVLNKKKLKPAHWLRMNKNHNAIDRAKQKHAPEPGPGRYHKPKKIGKIAGCSHWVTPLLPENKQRVFDGDWNADLRPMATMTTLGPERMYTIKRTAEYSIGIRYKEVASESITANVQYPPFQTGMGKQARSTWRSSEATSFGRAARFQPKT